LAQVLRNRDPANATIVAGKAGHQLIVGGPGRQVCVGAAHADPKSEHA
jgi:hypothetical protein